MATTLIETAKLNGVEADGLAHRRARVRRLRALQGQSDQGAAAMELAAGSGKHRTRPRRGSVPRIMVAAACLRDHAYLYVRDGGELPALNAAVASRVLPSGAAAIIPLVSRMQPRCPRTGPRLRHGITHVAISARATPERAC